MQTIVLLIYLREKSDLLSQLKLKSHIAAIKGRLLSHSGKSCDSKLSEIEKC